MHPAHLVPPDRTEHSPSPPTVARPSHPGPPAAAPPRRTLATWWAQRVVSLYRALGFAVLTIIVVVMVGYVVTSVFYAVSDRWIQPLVVSASDDRVLQLEAQLAAEQATRDRLAGDLAHTTRTVELQERYQTELTQAIRADLARRKAALARAQRLSRDHAGTRRRIRSSTRAFARSARARMEQEYRARLIDRGDRLASLLRLAQLATADLDLAERQASYDDRAAELAAETRAFETLAKTSGASAPLSYDTLQIQQALERSRVELARAREQRDVLTASLARQDALLASLRRAPYLRAIHDRVHVAFVPYRNLATATVGAPVYACALVMIGCRQVGRVAARLPGELVFRHPHRDASLRGQMVELALTDASAAQDDVLFVGRPPLLL